MKPIMSKCLLFAVVLVSCMVNPDHAAKANNPANVFTDYRLHLTAADLAAKGAVTSFDWWNFTPPANTHMRVRARVTTWFDTSPPSSGFVAVQIGVGGVFPVSVPNFPPGGFLIAPSSGRGPVEQTEVTATASPWLADSSLVDAQQLTIRAVTDGTVTFDQLAAGDIVLEVELYQAGVVTITP